MARVDVKENKCKNKIIAGSIINRKNSQESCFILMSRCWLKRNLRALKREPETWKGALESKGLHVCDKKTKVITSSEKLERFKPWDIWAPPDSYLHNSFRIMLRNAFHHIRKSLIWRQRFQKFVGKNSNSFSTAEATKFKQGIRSCTDSLQRVVICKQFQNVVQTPSRHLFKQ